MPLPVDSPEQPAVFEFCQILFNEAYALSRADREILLGCATHTAIVAVCDHDAVEQSGARARKVFLFEIQEEGSDFVPFLCANRTNTVTYLYLTLGLPTFFFLRYRKKGFDFVHAFPFFVPVEQMQIFPCIREKIYALFGW